MATVMCGTSIAGVVARLGTPVSHLEREAHGREHLLTAKAMMIYGSTFQKHRGTSLEYAFPEIIDRFGPRSRFFAATKLEQSA